MELLFRPYYTRWEVAEFLVNLLLDRLRIHLFNGVMFEHPPDLSSDIEYMLQSGQVSLKILSETLVDSWYPIIFQLALSILGNDVEARQVAIDTSVAALLGMHDYSSSTGVQKWLLRYAAHHILSKSKQGTAKGTLPDFRRWFPDRQERKPRNSSENTLEPENDEMKITWGVLASSLIEDRLPTILYYQLNLKIGDIAEILKCEEHTVHFRLQKSRSRLRRELEASGLHNAAIKTGYLERLLRRTCQQHRHDTQLQPNQRTMILLEISRLVNRKQVAQRAHITVQEFSTIALVVLVVAIISWGFSSLLPVPQSLPASQSTGSPVAEQSAAAVKPDRGDLQDQGDIEFPLDSVIHYIVQPGDTLDIVSKRLGTSPLVVKKLNNLPEDVSLLAGQVLELRTANTGGTGKFPVIAPYRSPVLLTAQSPPSLIFQRIQEHDLYYQSMWAEGRVIFYGPAGYSGPPRSSRIQVWSKPGSVLVIAGPPESNPDGVVLSINSSDSSSRKTYLALRSGDRDQWFYSDEEILQRKSPLETLAYPVEALELVRRMVQFQPGKTLFAPVQTETLSGRNTLVTDIVSQQDGKRGRLWIDRSNGIVLRWQHFTGLQDNIVDWEISLSKVVFDNSIHPDFFKPYYFLPENFAEDQYGLPVKAPEENASSINSRAYAHPELSFPAAPSNFDPADQWLVFQYPNSFNHLAPFSEVEIYSNEYYLGSLVFGNPWTVVCSRAPDGYKIAYATMLDNKTEEAFLNWFDLREPTIKVHNVLGGIAIHELAFSPDSRYLAVAGSYEGIGGIYLADMLTQRVQQLTQLVNAHSLAWSPDNTKLAVITGGEMIGSPEMLLVINIDSGQVVHRSLWNSLDSGSLKESPVMEWGIPYPVQPQGLEECARPPTGNE